MKLKQLLLLTIMLFIITGCSITNKGKTKTTKTQYYTIYFQSFSEFYLEPIKLKAGASIPKLPIPSKPNYTFAGWFFDEMFQIPFDYTTMPSRDLYLKAKWEVRHSPQLHLTDEEIVILKGQSIDLRSFVSAYDYNDSIVNINISINDTSL